MKHNCKHYLCHIIILLIIIINKLHIIIKFIQLHTVVVSEALTLLPGANGFRIQLSELNVSQQPDVHISQSMYSQQTVNRISRQSRLRTSLARHTQRGYTCELQYSNVGAAQLWEPCTVYKDISRLSETVVYWDLTATHYSICRCTTLRRFPFTLLHRLWIHFLQP